MTLVIGTDEAGYGPNLGPLVVAGTAWRIDAPPDEAEGAIAGALEQAERTVTGRIPHPLWGDSKEIYRSGSGLRPLELGVLVATALASGAVPASWTDLELAVGSLRPPETAGESPEWSLLRAAAVPAHVPAAEIEALAERIGQALRDRGVRLAAIGCRCVYAGRFNGELDRGRNKADILSRATLDLAASLASERDDEALLVWCDRHGGRKRYAGVVTEAFGELCGGGAARPLAETPSRSAYAIGDRGRIEFLVGGESRPPVAAASMTAKYVRERAMDCFNAFWSGRQPGLRPTAGYPLDARRWRDEAAEAILTAGVSPERLWRRA